MVSIILQFWDCFCTLPRAWTWQPAPNDHDEEDVEIVDGNFSWDCGNRSAESSWCASGLQPYSLLSCEEMWSEVSSWFSWLYPVSTEIKVGCESYKFTSMGIEPTSKHQPPTQGAYGWTTGANPEDTRSFFIHKWEPRPSTIPSTTPTERLHV